MKKCIILTFISVLFSLIAVAPNLSHSMQRTLELQLLAQMKRDQEMQRQEMEFENFCRQLGYKESNNNWQIVNSLGCMGEWQFTSATLDLLGYKGITPTAFKARPEIFPQEVQKKALKQLMEMNLAGLVGKHYNYLEYIGKIINGVLITKAGLVAGMHLGGIGSIQRYLASGGRVNAGDVYGTHISDYMREFSQYQI